MTNKTPRVAKTRRESTTPGTRKTGKLFFFLSSSSSSDNLAQRCLNLSQWFSHETAAFSTEQCNVPSLFRYLQVFTRRLQLPNHGFVCHAIFTFVRMRA